MSVPDRALGDAAPRPLVIVEIDEVLRGATAVLAHGVGVLNMRRAFANLRDQLSR